MKHSIILTFIFALIGVSYGQQDPQFSQYMFNNLYNNPGYSGIEGVSRATLMHRTQWLGYDGADPGGAPQTQILSISHPLKIMSSPVVNSGVGLYLINDKLGPLRNINIKGSYSYHYKLRNAGVIGFGLRAGFYSQGIDGAILREAEESDVVVDQLKTSPTQMKPDVGLGVWYQTKKYYGGVSLSHMTAAGFNFGASSQDINSQLARHMYITGGYHIMLGTKLRITPSAIIQTDFVETNYNYGVLADLYQYKYWAGFTIRQSVTGSSDGQPTRQIATDDLVFMGGISLLPDKSLRVGYAFDLVSSGPRAKNNTSHEIMLSYILPISVNDNPPPLRTPRYRHEN